MIIPAVLKCTSVLASSPGSLLKNGWREPGDEATSVLGLSESTIYGLTYNSKTPPPWANRGETSLGNKAAASFMGVSVTYDRAQQGK